MMMKKTSTPEEEEVRSKVMMKEKLRQERRMEMDLEAGAMGDSLTCQADRQGGGSKTP